MIGILVTITMYLLFAFFSILLLIGIGFGVRVLFECVKEKFDICEEERDG